MPRLRDHGIHPDRRQLSSRSSRYSGLWLIAKRLEKGRLSGRHSSMARRC